MFWTRKATIYLQFFILHDRTVRRRLLRYLYSAYVVQVHVKPKVFLGLKHI